MRLWINLSDMTMFVNPVAAWYVCDYAADGTSVQVTTDVRPTPFKVLDLTGKFQVPEYVVFHSIHEQSSAQLNVFESGFYALEYVDMQQVHQRLSDCLTVLHYLTPHMPVAERGDLRIFGTLHPDVYIQYCDAPQLGRPNASPTVLIDIINCVIVLRNAHNVDVRGLIEASHLHLRNPLTTATSSHGVHT